MIYTYVPYSPKDKPGNLGWTYRNFMEKIPSENDWVCFLDNDAVFTTPLWYNQMQDIIDKYPDYGAFTCMMNRVGQKYHVPLGVDRDNHDMRYHRGIGKKLAETYYDQITPLNDVGGQYLSGVLILIQKKAWEEIGGCPDGFLGVDNEIHRRCVIKGVKVGRMDGVYLYHWYRADGRDHVDKAMSFHPHALGRK
jgi:GT2 family glycosyltransferase